MTNGNIQEQIEKIKNGDKNALEDLVKRIQDRIFGLALRMLSHPEDAEDATQEILIKIITNLNTYRGEAHFDTWAMKITANHLLSARRSRGRASLSFKEMESRIVNNHTPPWKELEADPMRNLIIEEFRIACLQAVLLGLNRPHRLAYILGSVFDVSGSDGGEILGIHADTFRKRLQRARFQISDFLINHCALIRSGNPCICEQQADYFLSRGDFKRKAFVFVDHPCMVKHDPAALARLNEMDELKRINTLYKTHPGLRAPDSFVDYLRDLFDSDRFRVLRSNWM